MVVKSNGLRLLEEGDVVDLGICAVDADGVGAAPSRDGSRFDVGRMRSAVAALQSEGLKVILVSSRDLSPFLDGHTSAIDATSLLHVKALNETAVDLLKVADEYRCPFMATDDVASLHGDWRLPWRRQDWLRRVMPHLHIRFTFTADGAFGAAIPQKVREYLEAAREPLRKSPNRTPLASAAWLGGLEAPQPPAGSPLPPHVSNAPPEPPLPPPPPPAKALVSADAPAATWSQALGWAPAAAKGRGLTPFTYDDEWPCAAVIWPEGPCHAPGTAYLCLLCDEKSKGLFPYAIELSSRVLVCDQLQELEDEEDIRGEVCALVGAAQWGFSCFSTAMAVGGRDHGIRAVGVGSNSKARKRAARIALATVVRLRSPAIATESPDGTQAFAALVQRARRLFAGQGRGFPPKGGGAADPPPAVPSACPAEPGAGQSAAAPPGAGEPPEGPWAASSEQSSGGAPALNKRVVVAVAAYEAEGGGYLPLRLGDHACLLCDECFPPDDSCRFLQYVYGRRISGPSEGDGAPCDGWFPFDLVTLV